MNCRHHNVKFTVEFENNRSLRFLDIHLIIFDHFISTVFLFVFHKPIFTRLETVEAVQNQFS